MAINYPCEVCSEMWPENNLVLIEQTGKLTCPVCINQMISDLLLSISLASMG